MKDPTKKSLKSKDFARINSVKMGGGPHGGRCAKRACKKCGTVSGFRICPYCGKE